MTGALAITERARLVELEAVVERGLASFVEVGQALLAIRNERLYRAEFENFEAYCRERWGFVASRARQLVAAAETVTAVTEAGLPAPENERQARELVALGDEEAIVEVWRKLRDSYGENITAARVRRLVTNRMARIEREAEAQRVRDAALVEQERLRSVLRLGDGVEFHHTDFRALDIVPESVDLIFCDPPYVAEFDEEAWTDLGAFAARVLKPSRLFVAYSGNLYAREALAGLGAHLDYVTVGSVFMPGGHSLLRSRQVFTTSKPLLFFSAGPYRPRRAFQNGYWIRKAEKDLHPWQQEAGCAQYYVGTLTEPGEVVCDPFLGSGTTAVACRELGRLFIGCDLDAVALDAAAARIRELDAAAA